MRTTTKTYLLSPILHKDSYQFENGITIAIDKSFENNLRERNPQLGVVEATYDDSLKVGDIVAVNHFTFFGDIGPDKSFQLRDHTEIDGKKLFRATDFQIFFKYNNKTPEVLPGYLICDYEIEADERFGVYFGERKLIRCTHGKYEGKEVVVLKNAMYLITLDRVNYYKVREDEVVWAGEVVGNNLLVRFMPEKQHPLYTLKTNNQTAIALSSCGEIMTGDILQIYRNQGVDTPDGYCIPHESVIGVWVDGGTKIEDLKPTV